MSAKQFEESNKDLELLNTDKLKIACVVSDWHNEITEKLFNGAKNILIKNVTAIWTRAAGCAQISTRAEPDAES